MFTSCLSEVAYRCMRGVAGTFITSETKNKTCNQPSSRVSVCPGHASLCPAALGFQQNSSPMMFSQQGSPAWLLRLRGCSCARAGRTGTAGRSRRPSPRPPCSRAGRRSCPRCGSSAGTDGVRGHPQGRFKDAKVRGRRFSRIPRPLAAASPPCWRWSPGRLWRSLQRTEGERNSAVENRLTQACVRVPL